MADLTVTEQTCLSLVASGASCLQSKVSRSFNITQPLSRITILGVKQAPDANGATVDGQRIANVTYLENTQEVVLDGMEIDLNEEWEIKW